MNIPESQLMSTSPQILLADAPLTDPKTFRTERSASRAAKDDPLIDRGGQFAEYVGLILLAIMVAVIVGLVSRRMEHAIATALGLSAIFISFILFATR